MDEKQFFDKARQVAKAIDQDEYKVCSLEEAEAFSEKRKASAYELADFIDGNDCEYIPYRNVSAMLRHQADRIAELENQLDKCSHHEAMAHQGGYEIGYAEGLKKAGTK